MVWLWEDWIEDGLNVRGRDGKMFGMLDLKDRNKIWDRAVGHLAIFSLSQSIRASKAALS